MKSLINRYVSLFLLMSIIAVAFPGCFTGGSGNSDNPVASAVTPTETDSPVRAGTATVSFVIVIPDGANTGAVRASTISATLSVPTASATLFVDGKIAQRKSAPVVNGSVTLTFTGVQDSGTARLDLELIGCSVSGVTFFTGTSQITQNTVIVLSPSYPAGSNRTSDGKLLVELSSNLYRGRVFFDSVGNPVGQTTDGYFTEFETGNKYYYLSKFTYTDDKVGYWDYGLLNGHVFSGGGETLSEITTDGTLLNVYGDPMFPVFTGTGDTLANATFKGIGDMQVVGSKLYINEGYTHIAILENGTFTVIALSFNFDRFSVLDNGDIWVFNCNDDEGSTSKNTRISGSNAVEEVDMPGTYGTNSAITYGNGILFAGWGSIYYYDGTNITEWLSPSSIGSTVTMPQFFIYKNSVGQIYVCSERENKIWKVE